MPAKSKAKPKAKKAKTTSKKDYKKNVPKSTSKGNTQYSTCATLVRRDVDLSTLNNGRDWNFGALCNTAEIAVGAAISLSVSVALDTRNPILASSTHSTYIKLFNEYNTSSMYVDIMLSKEIRDNCDQLLILTESSKKDVIDTPEKMLSDVATKMYQIYDNTNKITFAHKFTSAGEKINKKSAEAAEQVSANDLTYLKILAIGKNQTGAIIPEKELQISFRVKMYNSYHDMAVLANALN